MVLIRNISYGNKKIDFLEKYIKLIVIIVYRYNTFRMTPTPSKPSPRKKRSFENSVPANDSKNRKLCDGSRSPVHLYYGSCECADCALVRDRDFGSSGFTWDRVKPEPNLRKRWRMYVDPVFPQFLSHPSWMHQQPLYPTPELPYKPQHHKSQCR